MSRRTLGLILLLVGFIFFVALHYKAWDEKAQIEQHKQRIEEIRATAKRIAQKFDDRGRWVEPSPPDFLFNARESYWIYLPPILGLMIVGALLFRFSLKPRRSSRDHSDSEGSEDLGILSQIQDRMTTCDDD